MRTPTATWSREHADAEWRRVQRGAAKLDYGLALGRPDLYPEQRVDVSGFKKEIDERTWLISKAAHSIKATGGFTTSLELETSIAPAERNEAGAAPP